MRPRARGEPRGLAGPGAPRGQRHSGRPPAALGWPQGAWSDLAAAAEGRAIARVPVLPSDM